MFGGDGAFAAALRQEDFAEEAREVSVGEEAWSIISDLKFQISDLGSRISNLESQISSQPSKTAMNCRQTRAIIESDEESRLSPETKGAWAAHLASCTDCRREKESAELLSALLRSRAPDNLPPGYWDSFWPRVSARLSGETAPAPRRFFRNPFALNWSPAPAWAAVAVVLALAVVGGRHLIVGRQPAPAAPALLSSRRLPAASAAGVDYVIARADRPRQAPEAHFVLARGRVSPLAPASLAYPALPAVRSSPAFPALPAYHAAPADHFILTSGSREGRQPQVYW
jgi:hypothetical protein